MTISKLNPEIELLAIGGSAGSLSMVLKIIQRLKSDINFAVIIVFHRKSADETLILNVLSEKTELVVKEADEKDPLVPGLIYVAPADYHLLIEKDHTLSLDYSEKVNFSRPSIDVTFASAAEVYADRLACLLLSGANTDGVEGLLRAKASGSLVFIQDPACAEVPYMPQEAVDRVPYDLLITEQNLQEVIARLQMKA